MWTRNEVCKARWRELWWYFSEKFVTSVDARCVGGLANFDLKVACANMSCVSFSGKEYAMKSSERQIME